MASIKDVAREAGVSISTVSHVINKTKYVSEEKVKKVNNTILKLGYTPNIFAKGLKTKKSNIISLILHDTLDPLYISLINGVTKIAEQNSYGVMLFNSENNVKKEEESLKHSISKSVDGIILDPVGVKNCYIKKIIDKEIPIVFAERLLREIKAPSVLANIEEGTYKAIQYLINNDHKNIGFITDSSNINTSKDSFAGYKKALADNNISLKSEYIKTGVSSHTGGYKSVISLMLLSKKPSAIFISDKLMTIGGIDALNHLNIKQPNEIELIGISNDELSTIINPTLSILSLPTQLIGIKSTELLIELIEGRNGNDLQTKYLPTELIIKDYTKTIML